MNDFHKQGDRLLAVSISPDPRAQGGGDPKVGDKVTVADHAQAVIVRPYLEGGALYWCQGENESGEYGAYFSHLNLAKDEGGSDAPTQDEVLKYGRLSAQQNWNASFRVPPVGTAGWDDSDWKRWEESRKPLPPIEDWVKMERKEA